jgi:ribosomal protein S18 acetylase RimI-like enzyme
VVCDKTIAVYETFVICISYEERFLNLSYRAVLPEDFSFLFDLHKDAMQEHVEASFGPWDENWQETYFRKNFDPSELQIIQCDGQDVGMLYIQERVEELFIVNLEILPAYQRRGIGSAVVRGLIAATQRRGKPVALQVLKSNIHARNLYQRLGFGVTGENETHYIMAWEKVIR